MDIQLSHHHLLRRQFLPPLNWLGILVENQLTVNARGYFWALISVPCVHTRSYICIFIATLCLSLCQYKQSFEIRSVCPPTWFFFFKIVFSYSGYLAFPYEFYSHFVSFYKDTSWDFDRIALNL